VVVVGTWAVCFSCGGGGAEAKAEAEGN